jgi:hypothetical protein
VAVCQFIPSVCVCGYLSGGDTQAETQRLYLDQIGTHSTRALTHAHTRTHAHAHAHTHTHTHTKPQTE